MPPRKLIPRTKVDMQVHPLPEDCTMQWVGSFHEAMCNELPSITGLTLDGSAVETVQTPAIQVLVCLGKALAARTIPFAIKTPSAALSAGFADLGLAESLLNWSTETDG